MNPGEVVWADPPADGRSRKGSVDASMRRRAMDEHPGRWMLYGEYAARSTSSTTASRLRAAGYEAVSRGLQVYARRPEGWKP